MSPSDEALYEYVGREIESGLVRAGLWTMALAKSGYDETKAKALYIEYRLEVIKQELADSASNTPPPNALDRLEKEFLREKAEAKAAWNAQESAAEVAKLGKWKIGIKTAKKHLSNPIPAELYARRHRITVEDVLILIGKAELHGYSVGGELYVDDSPYPQIAP